MALSLHKIIITTFTLALFLITTKPSGLLNIPVDWLRFAGTMVNTWALAQVELLRLIMHLLTMSCSSGAIIRSK